MRNARQIQTRFGFYAQDQVAHDNWRLTVGLRHDRADTELNQVTAGTQTSQSDSALTLNVGNLFDKAHVARCSSATACYFGDRRLVLTGVRYKW